MPMEIMLNILPPEKKEDIRLARKYRMLLWVQIAICFLVFFFGLLLVGVWYALEMEEREVRREGLKRESQDAAYAQMTSMKSELMGIQRLAFFAEDTLKKQRFATWVFRLLETSLPSGVHVSSILLEEKSLKISGRAETREALISLQENLEKERCFSGISLPSSQIAKKEDIDFEMVVSLDESCFFKM